MCPVRCLTLFGCICYFPEQIASLCRHQITTAVYVSDRDGIFVMMRSYHDDMPVGNQAQQLVTSLRHMS